MIANTTPPGHELIVKYHRNGRVKERGLMKNNKKMVNGFSTILRVFHFGNPFMKWEEWLTMNLL